MAESEGGCARIEIVPVVVGHCYSDGDILCSVIVGMSDEGSLPVGVKIGIGDCDTRAAMRDVEKTVVAGQKGNSAQASTSLMSDQTD
jgi:hypothetical protein